MSKQLIRRLQSVIARWPVDSSRKGRDLGEFLATSYLQKFKELANNDPVQAEASVKSLERLVSDHHRQLYARNKEYSVLSEELEDYSIEKVASVTLSTKRQEEIKEKPQSLWQRVTGKRLSKD